MDKYIRYSCCYSKIKAKHILLLSDSCYVGNAFKGNNDEIINTQKKM